MTTLQPATAACDVGRRMDQPVATWRVAAFFPETGCQVWLQRNGQFGASAPNWATVARFERGPDAYVAASRAELPAGAVLGYFDFPAGQ